jgi:hypothetical protein
MALQKHLLNDADTLVVDSLAGLCAVNNQLAFDPPNKGLGSLSRAALVSDGSKWYSSPSWTAPRSRSSVEVARAMSRRMRALLVSAWNEFWIVSLTRPKGEGMLSGASICALCYPIIQ